MTLKLGMQHRVHEYYKVCLNDAPVLALTYFTLDFSETIVVYE